jgi:hypothetical protein
VGRVTRLRRPVCGEAAPTGIILCRKRRHRHGHRHSRGWSVALLEVGSAASCGGIGIRKTLPQTNHMRHPRDTHIK